MTKQPGQPVRGSTSGRPIMVLLDILGQRWTLRILWELRHGPLTFRSLQDACEGVSPTVLNNRLKELRAHTLVSHNENGYQFTQLGSELASQLEYLDKWSGRWARQQRHRPPLQAKNRTDNTHT